MYGYLRWPEQSLRLYDGQISYMDIKEGQNSLLDVYDSQNSCMDV